MKQFIMCIACMILCISISIADDQDASSIVKSSFDYMRGKASFSTVVMTIHRPSWQREMTLKVWTLGESDSLFTIVSPPRDHGNGTLKKKSEMWIYNPKVNRVIKLPPSMMSQSWQGSDFSNNDLAKSDTLIHDYHHTLIQTEIRQNHKVYHIKSMPKPDAAVIWGMLEMEIRDDSILLKETFFDEDLKPVKTLSTSKIQLVGDKLFPKVWQMEKVHTTDEYTRIQYLDLNFKETMNPSLFTLTSLKNVGK